MGHTDSEASLRAERDAALAQVRAMEHELGRLRGRLKRLESLSAWRRTWRRLATAVVYRAGRVRRR